MARSRIGSWLLLGLLFPLPAWAAESEFQLDPIEYYGSRFLAGVLAIGILLILYSVVRYRGKTSGAVSWTLLITGIVVVPTIVAAFSTLLVFERAERVEFCASCHLTMISYVNDMTNPASESLAALHYKNRYIPSNQCYVCHTSYGMFGTVEAKMSGMTDTYRYYTRTYKLPIKMRHPYPNHDCLKCHAEAVKWQKQHADFKEDLFTEKAHCLDCHGANNPAHTLSK
jgi:cytochrome c nitrite reductase small subunit